MRRRTEFPDAAVMELYLMRARAKRRDALTNLTMTALIAALMAIVMSLAYGMLWLITSGGEALRFLCDGILPVRPVGMVLAAAVDLIF